MELFKPEDERYLAMAIHAVLRQHKNKLHTVSDPYCGAQLLKEMSREIAAKAKWLKTLSDSLCEVPEFAPHHSEKVEDCHAAVEG